MKLKRFLSIFVAIAITVCMMSSLVLADEAEAAPEETAAVETSEPKEKETKKAEEKKPAETKATEPEDTKPSEKAKETEPSEAEEKEPAETSKEAEPSETEKQPEETKTEESSEPAETAETKPAETEEKEPAGTEPSEPSESEVPEAETPETVAPAVSDSKEAKERVDYYGKVKWAFNESTGVLTVSPEKAKSKVPIPDDSAGTYPWVYYRNDIKKIVIANGITSIAANTFNSSCPNLESVTIAGSVTSIGGAAFAYNYGIKSVSIGKGVKKIEPGIMLSTGVRV